MAFVVDRPDYLVSPLTGMGRAHWQDAARYLLEGVLRHQDDADMPIRMPGDSPDASVNMEALSRTFMLAAPLLAGNPDEEIAGLRLRDYYAGQILLALDPASRWYVGDPLESARKRGRPTGTVDGAAIALGLWMAGPQLWDSFADAERAVVGSWLHAVAHGRTISHNFRWFNVTMASFLATRGWEIDTVMVADHLQNLLAYYAGDGWYRDAGNFDFYSSWAFQFYAPIWCAMYGNEHMPETAALLAANHNDLMCTYPALFGRDGTMPMWGRSICYRSAATVPLASAFLLNEPSVDPGWARRICSGSLLQFLTRDDVFTDGVATLGFTRAFPPVVQSYSGAASPYWWSKLFLALCLPEDSPFWTATENEGGWESLSGSAAADVHTPTSRTFHLPGPGMAITMHGSTGAAELRTAKVSTKSSNLLYTRLVYNTAFPGEDDNPAGATAVCYAARQTDTELPGGMHDGVLYRQTDLEGWMARAELAEIILPGGVLRVDRVSLPYPHDLRLGHFALPHAGGGSATVQRFDVAGAPAIIAHGPDGRAVALVALHGWDEVGSELHTGLNPETDDSTLIYARHARSTPYTGMALLVTLLLHRSDGGEWTEAELSPVVSLEILPWSPSGSPCGARVVMLDGREHLIDFGTMGGRL